MRGTGVSKKFQKLPLLHLYWELYGILVLMRDDPEDPERDVISRLEEMKSWEWILIIA